KVEAVGGAPWRCSGAAHVSAGFGHGVHGAEMWIEIAVARVTVDRSGDASLRSPDAQHRRVPLTGSGDRGGLACVVVLLVDRPPRSDVRRREQLEQNLADLPQFDVGMPTRIGLARSDDLRRLSR